MTNPAQAPAIEFETALSRVEQALERVNAHLAQGPASGLEAACQSLQDAMMACARARPQWLKNLPANPKLKMRLELVRAGMAQVREHTARKAAGVQRALKILLPSSSAATYGRGAAAYGAGQKSVAAFTSLSA